MNKIIFKVLVVPVFFLAGCATVKDLRNNRPDLDLTSVNKAKDVGICIADRFENETQNLGTMSARETSNGYSVVIIEQMPGLISSQKDAIVVVDITNTQSGSHTLFFNNFLGGGQIYYRIIRDCQSK